MLVGRMRFSGEMVDWLVLAEELVHNGLFFVLLNLDVKLIDIMSAVV